MGEPKSKVYYAPTGDAAMARAAEMARETFKYLWRELTWGSADPSGLTTLHSLALGGSAAGVRVLLEKGARRDAKTKSGKTALDLARQMGWPRVIELLRS